MHTKCTTSHIAPPTTTTTANAPTSIQDITNGHAALLSSSTISPTQHAHIQNIPVAFVEFKDIASAGNAMITLQGKFLLSSDRPIRIEFAKSKMVANTVDTNIFNSYPNYINSTPIKHHTALLLREVCSLYLLLFNNQAQLFDCTFRNRTILNYFCLSYFYCLSISHLNCSTLYDEISNKLINLQFLTTHRNLLVPSKQKHLRMF